MHTRTQETISALQSHWLQVSSKENTSKPPAAAEPQVNNVKPLQRLGKYLSIAIEHEVGELFSLYQHSSVSLPWTASP